MPPDEILTYKNKPRAFLSHSKLDADFIERAAIDLRRCHIEPWLDTEEIRHGKPWLSEIFEAGIPTCDCVLVYLTENSINSAMVQKEMDAGFVQQLKDRHVGLLPYVSDAGLRSRLRLDVQSLQTPEWNSSNYTLLLPRIVAEIWRGYLERLIPAAVAAERAQRLETQLALEKLRREADSRVFTRAEDKDFDYIRQTLDREESFTLSNRKHDSSSGDEKVLQTAIYKINLLSFVIYLLKEECEKHENSEITD
jgi:hypothetical protein